MVLNLFQVTEPLEHFVAFGGTSVQNTCSYIYSILREPSKELAGPTLENTAPSSNNTIQIKQNFLTLTFLGLNRHLLALAYMQILETVILCYLTMSLALRNSNSLKRRLLRY